MADALIQLQVKGANDLAKASRALREAGGPELVRRLTKNIRGEVAPAIKAVRRNARGRLPQSGGLAGTIARSKMNTRVRTTPNTAEVTIVASHEHDIRRINKGWVRHPLFGDRSRWYSQRVTPGWFTRPLDQRQTKIRGAVQRAIDDMIRELDRG